MAEPDEIRRDRLDQRGRTADVGQRPLVRGEGDLPEHLFVDPAVVTLPAGRRRAGERVGYLKRLVLGREPLEFFAEDDVPVGTRGEEQADGGVVSSGLAVPDHRQEGRYARSARDEEQGTALPGLPGEPAPDRTPQLQPVAGPDLIRQVGRDLAILQTLDEELDPAVFRCRGYGVTALRLVTVLGGEPDIYMLARPVPLPARNVQEQTLRPRRVWAGLDDLADTPCELARGVGHLSRPSSAARATGRRGYGSRGTPRNPARPRSRA